MAVCGSCRRPILWVRMATTNKAMPVDPDPEKRIIVGPSKFGSIAQMVDTYQSHFATCPNAARHRKPRARAAE